MRSLFQLGLYSVDFCHWFCCIISTATVNILCYKFRHPEHSHPNFLHCIDMTTRFESICTECNSESGKCNRESGQCYSPTDFLQFPPYPLVDEWKNDPRKQVYWNNPQFLKEYAESELFHLSFRYYELVKQSVKSCVKELLRNQSPRDDGGFDKLNDHPDLVSNLQLVWSLGGGSEHPPDGLTVRVLSLGCGPGTDLLGIVKVLAEDDRVACIECIGIDLLSHPLCYLIQQLEIVLSERPQLQINLKIFSQADANNFVAFCATNGLKFDLVSARYINASGIVDMFSHGTPNLLGDYGTILLLENASEKLKTLKMAGFSEVRVESLQRADQMFLVYQNRYRNRPLLSDQ